MKRLWFSPLHSIHPFSLRGSPLPWVGSKICFTPTSMPTGREFEGVKSTKIIYDTPKRNNLLKIHYLLWFLWFTLVWMGMMESVRECVCVRLKKLKSYFQQFNNLISWNYYSKLYLIATFITCYLFLLLIPFFFLPRLLSRAEA